MPTFCHPWDFFCNFFYCCFIFVAKKRSAEVLVELNSGLCVTHNPFDRDNIRCELSSQILHHVIPQRQLSTPEPQARLRACPIARKQVMERVLEIWRILPDVIMCIKYGSCKELLVRSSLTICLC